jgi:hypothetical protein
VPENVIELHPRVAVPLPIESQRGVLADAAQDVLVGEVPVGQPERRLPGPAAEPGTVFRRIRMKKVSLRHDPPDDTGFAVPRDVFAGESNGGESWW